MRYAFIFLLLAALACRDADPEMPVDPYAYIRDTDAREILRAAIEYAGGLDRWQAMKRLSYNKDFQLLDASGKIERSYRQVHDYQYDPVHLNIRSIENGDTLVTILQKGRYHRTLNGRPVQVDQALLEQAVNSSLYVVGIPFKLLDPGPPLRYIGTDTLEGAGIVDVLEINYANDPEDPGSDIWRYYFDRPDRKVVANWVSTADHFSLVENLSYERVGGMLFHKARKSYRVDSLGNKLYLRAAYLYGQYRVQ